MCFNPISVSTCVLLGLMEMVMGLGQVMAITTPVPKVEEMPRATQERPLLTGENPEVEDVPQLSEESPLWGSKGSHVSITGGLRIRIPFNLTPLKWNHTIVRGGLLSLGRSPPPTSSIIHHPLVVLHKDPNVRGAHTSMATLQVKGHPPQDIFLATYLTGGQVQHHLTRGL